MAVSLLLHLLLRDGYSEFKRERIVAFWELIEKDQPDVIACQELYGSWFLGSNVNKSRMIKAAKRLGYCHVNSGKPRLPALLFDQGLCIFSKWPIIESGHLIYKSQSVFDKYFVNRAALFACVDIGNGRKVKLFTTHTSPSMADMNKRTKLASCLPKERVSTVSRQAGEMVAFVKQKGGGDDPEKCVTIILGDFNVEGGDKDYDCFASEFKKLGVLDHTTNDDGTWPATFGIVNEDGKPTETLLTSPGLLMKPQALDFIFSNGHVFNNAVEVLPMRVKGEAKIVKSRASIQQSSISPIVAEESLLTSSPVSSALSISSGGSALKKKIDIPLALYFLGWYVGNYYYNITNKLALRAAGGKTGFPMTISSLQMGVGCLYGLFMWVAPDGRSRPKISTNDIIAMLPVAFCAMGSHCASVFALSAGAVSFAQIVKSAEPVFSAILSQFVYGKKISRAKWMCLPIVVGGVILASVKELDFAWSALIAACIGNLFAAFKGNENKKLMETDGLKDRVGNVGNLFAITSMLAFAMSVPLFVIKEGARWGQFTELWKTNPIVSFNLIASGLYWYFYNELATLTIKKTSAVTASVANTAKRVIVIVGVALVLGESLDPIKMLGCGIGISGVLLYSVIDELVKKK
ncbi:hypothetical protein ScalyP_jg7996 [Parmales sp. scaly parma]|nr:hypothetical protein ScalyP_jg7996 [Parmales sp. scaly parma]